MSVEVGFRRIMPEAKNLFPITRAVGSENCFTSFSPNLVFDPHTGDGPPGLEDVPYWRVSSSLPEPSFDTASLGIPLSVPVSGEWPVYRLVKDVRYSIWLRLRRYGQWENDKDYFKPGLVFRSTGDEWMGVDYSPTFEPKERGWVKVTGRWAPISSGGALERVYWDVIIQAGEEFLDIAMPCIMLASKDDNSLIPNFDGSFPPEPGVSYSWDGPVNNSPSSKIVDGFQNLDTDTLTLVRELPWTPGASEGIASASGSADVVLPVGLNPWSSKELPQTGDSMRVKIDGIPKLTGVVAGTSGSAGTGDVVLSFFDEIDRLNRPVSVPGWLARMPTRTGMKWVGLRDTAIIEHVIAKAGFEATPRPSGASLIAPLQGSAWLPDAPDSVLKASESTNDNATAMFDVCSWGVGLSDGDCRWRPDGARILTFDTGFRLGFHTQRNTLYAPTTNAHVRLALIRGAGTPLDFDVYIGVEVTPTNIQANYSYNGASGVLCQIDRNDSEQHVNLVVAPDGTVTLTDGVQTATGNRPDLSGAFIDGVQAWASWTSPMLGGIYLDLADAPLDFQRTAFLQADFEAGSANEEITAFPSFAGKAINLLKAHSAALGSVFWLDEDGHLQWRRAKRLLNRVPSRTLTATDDLLALGWKMDTSETFSGVKFNFRPVAVDRGEWTYAHDFESVLLWQGSGARIQGSEVREEFFGPEDSEEWFYPNLIFNSSRTSVNNTTPEDRNRFNFGLGSWMGGVKNVSGDSTQHLLDSTYRPNVVVTNFASDPRKYKLTIRDYSLTSSESIDFKVPKSESSGGPVGFGDVSAQWEGENLPIIRGLAKATWSDDFVTAGTVSGYWAGLPVLEREAGEWIQNRISAQQQADWLNSLVTKRTPRLENVPIIPDYDLRLGDVVWLTDEVFSKVKLKVLVTRTDYQFSPGDSNMSIGCFVIESEGI